MQIFNFKKFNESNSDKITLTEEHCVILQDIIEDLWIMDREPTVSNRSFRQTDPPELKRGNIAIRSSTSLSPGSIPSIIGGLINKSDIYGFSINLGVNFESLLKRSLDLFKRQTGIELSTYKNKERQTIIAEPHVIEFIRNILNFEDGLSELLYLIPAKYEEEVFFSRGDRDLEIDIHLTEPKPNAASCYIETELSRGLIIGGDLPIDDMVKYDLKIGSLRKYKENLYHKSIWQIAKVHEGDRHQFEFDIDDIKGSNEELLDFYHKTIISKIETPTIKMKSEVESQLDQLKKYSIMVDYEYYDYKIINLNLNWGGDNYHLWIYLDKLVDSNSDVSISIKQDVLSIDISSIGDLAENIYLNLMDGKLKITK